MVHKTSIMKCMVEKFALIVDKHRLVPETILLRKLCCSLVGIDLKEPTRKKSVPCTLSSYVRVHPVSSTYLAI